MSQVHGIIEARTCLPYLCICVDDKIVTPMIVGTGYGKAHAGHISVVESEDLEALSFVEKIPIENPRRAGSHLTSIRVIGAAFGSDPNRSSREVTCLPIAQIIRGRMIIFVSVIGALVVASTVFALLIPSGAKVTLSDIAQEMDNLHRSQSDRPPLT
jgi:hypothetical protein